MGLSMVDIVGGFVLVILLLGYFMVVAKLSENIEEKKL